MQNEVESVLSQFKSLDRENRKVFLLSFVEECDPHEIFILQKILKSKGLGMFDIIGALPPELSVKIFAFLNGKDLCTCREVCKTWMNITNESTIWRLKCLEMLYINQGITTTAQNMNIPKEGWKKMYQKQYRREINWNSGQTQTVKFLLGHRERITDAKLKENILVTGSADRTVRIWNIETEECIRTLCGNSFSCVDFLLEEQIVAASTFFRASFIWNMETGELLRELSGHVSAVRCISLSRSYVASCAFDGSLIVWNWETGEKIATIPAEATAIRIFENTVLSHSSSSIKAFDIPSGNCIFSTAFNEGQLGWNYIQNYLSSKSAEETMDEFPDQIILSPNILNTIRNYSNSRVHNFDTRRGRMVSVSNRESSEDILQLIILNETSQPKEIIYPKGTDLNKEIFRTLNIDHRRIIVGCLSGTIAILDFEEES
ncbi:WD40-repeat-containing domain protein [Glomus cerebriforme]|uniref:WD40-repeat-containing domain protein n=1 Tax=Glomus cerebriforme TaxID=658196 RepID=A0A397TIK1_9GLOM|nr:WD40-repeat-containing domain protein [Glomus cerebriforme]